MRKKTQSPQTWPGQFYFPWTLCYPVEVLLRSTNNVCPAVAESLRDKVLPQCDTSFEQERVMSTLVRMTIHRFYPQLDAPDKEIVKSVLRPILDWAQEYHLARSIDALNKDYGIFGSHELSYLDTLAQAAYLTVQKWKEDPKRAAALGWIKFLRPFRPAEGIEEGRTEQLPTQRLAEFSLVLEGWDPATETEKAAAERMLAKVKAMLDEQTQEALRLGGLPTPRSCEQKHFDWLVMWQVDRKSKNQIRKDVHKTWAAVHKAIRRAAALLVGPRNVDNWLRRADIG